MRYLMAKYGRNVELLIKAFALEKKVEFVNRELGPQELGLFADVGLVITPTKTYVYAATAKKLAAKHQLNHKKFKKELMIGGKINYVPVVDEKIGEVSRWYVLETPYVIEAIEEYVNVPPDFSYQVPQITPGPFTKKVLSLLEHYLKLASSRSGEDFQKKNVP
ncbi:hypothetical protein A3L09_10685 (plasmid) [Thermococcus profundus]|uniref:Uncharacterized protein n=2 Tax=Thermococcus profundus TaxID=49899 RepID=A0A2Z2MD73_THEPR|nr:hypothetical protein A3L09_10685 [Thermococcus profundus]